MPDSDKPTLLVIDGHSLAFRAFYALPVDSFQNRDGQHTNAIHGFLSMMLLLLQKEKPTHLAVAFDLSRQSFRTREYPEYKGTRSQTPAEFVGQVPLLQEALHAMGITTITKEDYEADDIMATLATQGAALGYRVLVVSGDRDSIQLVNDDVVLLYPNARGVSELKRYDREAVVERYGIQPEQYPDVAALVGETSDNLIGIDKVGEKTAVKWITEYGSLEGVLDHAAEIKGVVGQKLREQQDRAVRNRKLNRLLTDVELPVGPPDLARQPIDEAKLRELFDRLQFRTLLERVLKIAADSGQSVSTAVAGEGSASPARSIPPVLSLGADTLRSWVESASEKGTRPLGLQLELGPNGLAGVGLASASETVSASWSDSVRTELADWLASAAPKRVFDSKAMLTSLWQADLELGGVDFDTTLGAWLLRPGGHDQPLAQQVYSHLGEHLAEPDPNQLVPETAASSPATEAWYVLRVAEYLENRLSSGSLSVLRKIELPLVPVLAKMEQTGITVNAGLLHGLDERLTDTANALAQQAFEVVGHELNLGSPKQLQQVLFEELGMPKTRANKTGYSTDATSLTDLQDLNPHPFLDLLLRHRDATKLKQIVETLERSIGSDHRIHTRYEQTGSSTGRMSSTDPNLQNVPIKTEVGRQIRSAFEKGEGFGTLLTADYSQIEMRIMAHLSGDSGLIEAFHSGEDLHRFVGSRVFGVAASEVTASMRSKVKAMSYGLAYGLSAFGLSKQLRIDISEAKQLMGDYFLRFGGVRDYLRGVVVKAKEDGYTETIFGRRRPFADLTSSNRVLRENAERQALNAPIQGSAADIMKIAMLGVAADLDEKGLRSQLLLQVHDELVFEVAEGELELLSAIVTDRMAHAADLTVPLDVQLGTGPNWDAAAH
ncbi:DNA polymerase I [soil metagenome]